MNKARYIGYCPECAQGFSTDESRITCTGCSSIISLSLVHGQVSDHGCDPACMYAVGSLCVCSCGGGNHGMGWATRSPAWAIERLRVLCQRTAARRAEKAAERREAQSAAQQALEAQRQAFESTHGDLIPLMQGYADENSVLADMLGHFESRGVLSDRQVEFAQKIIAHIERRAKWQDEAQALSDAGVRAPEGRVTVEGVVRAIKSYEYEGAYGYGTQALVKMLVVTDEGWKAWSTVPRSIDGVEVGDRVRMVATLTVTDDVCFAKASRPSNATILSGVAA